MNKKRLLERGHKDMVFVTSFLGLLAASASAQSGVAFFGNTQIGPGTELNVNSYPVQLTGITTTQRGATAGVLSLSNGAAVGTGSATGFINGFVRSYGTGTVLFAVGSNTIYAPVTITAATTAAVNVAYNAEAFNATSFNATVLNAVSATEYWDVLGNNSGIVSLTWQSASGLDALTDDVTKITIAGWNGTNWVPVAGTLSDGASVSRGSLTTSTAVDFTQFSAFTFAVLPQDITGISGPAATQTFMFINSGNFNLSSLQGVAQVQLYDVTGKMVETYTVNAGSYQAGFDHAKGIYIAKALLTNGQMVTRKLLNQ